MNHSEAKINVSESLQMVSIEIRGFITYDLTESVLLTF